jgi:hypothetical protein
MSTQPQIPQQAQPDATVHPFPAPAAVVGEVQSHTSAERAREIRTRLAELKGVKAEVESEIADLEATLVHLLGEGDFAQQFGVRITTGRRFDAQHLAEQLAQVENGRTWLDLVTRPMVDAKLAKTQLPPALYALGQKANSKVSVSLVDPK